MKNGAEYAKRVKRFFNRMRSSVSAEPSADKTEPLEQLMFAQLSWDATAGNAHKAARKLSEEMIDLNEVRVSTPREIAAVIRECVPNPLECARAISRSLNSIFQRENLVSLSPLLDKGRREARQYLESLDGVNAYASASVLLWALGAHAVPVNLRMLRALRKEDLVHPDANPDEVQAFLERHVAAAEAKTFCRVMEKLASQKGAPSASGSRKKAVAKPKRKAKAGTKARKAKPPKTAASAKRTTRKKKAARG